MEILDEKQKDNLYSVFLQKHTMYENAPKNYSVKLVCFYYFSDIKDAKKFFNSQAWRKDVALRYEIQQNAGKKHKRTE